MSGTPTKWALVGVAIFANFLALRDYYFERYNHLSFSILILACLASTLNKIMEMREETK